jgi:two-component system, NtrC family, response regulator AtoC
MAAGAQESVLISSSARPLSSGSDAWVVPVSQSMKTVENIVTEIAPTDIPVLVIGESGTGKEVLARRIHSLSRRFNQPLIKITCASMTGATVSQNLARSSRPANAETSDSAAGTVLFDELSDLDVACQTALLHALPDGETTAMSGSIASRIISSTTRDLAEETRAGRFRSELYYRINGVSVCLPPLRERKDDIPGLVEFLLTKHAVQLGRPQPALRRESLQTLLEYSWPGNIRELENVVRKIVVLGDDSLAVSELQSAPSRPRQTEAGAARSHSLKAAARAAAREAERELILWALTRTRWNRKRAAQELQISYKSLLYKLKQIGIDEGKAN